MEKEITKLAEMCSTIGEFEEYFDNLLLELNDLKQCLISHCDKCPYDGACCDRCDIAIFFYQVFSCLQDCNYYNDVLSMFPRIKLRMDMMSSMSYCRAFFLK